MANYWEDLSRSETKEVVATIGRIDELIGAAHWPSVGAYKESVIRRKLADHLPRRYSIGTGFVLHDVGPRLLSKQIDVMIWDSFNYGPIFQDGSFVIIHPHALRAAIEVKGNLTRHALDEALENLDSLSQFLPAIDEHHSGDPGARIGFCRYVMAAASKLTFPTDFFNGLYRYYLRCIYDKDNPTTQHVQLTMSERNDRASLWGLTPWISGIAALGSGMLRIVRTDDRTTSAYVVSNDVKQDHDDHTIGLIQRAIDRFLTPNVVSAAQRDFTCMGRELRGALMPVPWTDQFPKRQHTEVIAPDEHDWTLENAKQEKAKRDERDRRRKAMEAQDED